MGKAIVEEKSYKFEMPDRTIKHPIDSLSKTSEQLRSEWIMIDTAVREVSNTLETVNWKLLIVDPRLTVTFIEAKTGLMSTLKKLTKVREAIEKEITKNERANS